MRSRLHCLCLLASFCGCVHQGPEPVSPLQGAEDEQARCEVVRAVLREQAQRDAQPLELPEDPTQEPVQVFLWEGDSPALERFFTGEPECGLGRYRVVEGSDNLALTLLLTPTAEGYAWEAHRGEGLVVPEKAAPMGHVLRGSAGWVVDVP